MAAGRCWAENFVASSLRGEKSGASTGLPVAIRPASCDPNIHPIALSSGPPIVAIDESNS
jgi:hypothetical protein